MTYNVFGRTLNLAQLQLLNNFVHREQLCELPLKHICGIYKTNSVSTMTALAELIAPPL